MNTHRFGGYDYAPVAEANDGSFAEESESDFAEGEEPPAEGESLAEDALGGVPEKVFAKCAYGFRRDPTPWAPRMASVSGSTSSFSAIPSAPG